MRKNGNTNAYQDSRMGNNMKKEDTEQQDENKLPLRSFHPGSEGIKASW